MIKGLVLFVVVAPLVAVAYRIVRALNERKKEIGHVGPPKDKE